MGKTRKPRRSLPARTDPVGLDSAIAELQQGMDQEDPGGSVLETILAQLQSANPEDKVCGCHAIARHADSGTFVRAALQARVARVVAPLLAGPDPMVRLAAAGALKNLSLDRSPLTAAALVEQDVMTPLAALLSSLPPSGPQQPPAPPPESPVQGLELLCNLLEGEDTALRAFTALGLAPLVAASVSPGSPPAVAQAALSVLAAATDSNPAGGAALRREDPGLEGRLLLLADGAGPPLLPRVTAALVLAHLAGPSLYSQAGLSALGTVLGAVSAALAPDTLAALAAALEGREEGMEVEEKAGKDGRKQKRARAGRMVEEAEEEGEGLAAARDLLAAQATALELLVNLASLGEEDEEWEEAEEERSEEEEEELEELEEGPGPEAPPVLAELVSSLGLMGRVVRIATSPLPKVTAAGLQDSGPGRALAGQHAALRARALLTLSSLAPVLGPRALGDDAALHTTWAELGALCLGSTEDPALLEAACAALCAVTRILCSAPGGRQLLQLSPQDLQGLLALYASAADPLVRVQLVQTVGLVAGLAASHGDTASIQVLGGLATWLLETAARDSDLPVAGEALDAFMDVFTEDSQDALFARLGLLQKVRHAVTGFKARVGAEGGSLPRPSLALLHQARSNLQRFVKYKQRRPLIQAAG